MAAAVGLGSVLMSRNCCCTAFTVPHPPTHPHQCAAGKIAASVGTATCSDCTAGNFAPLGSAACSQCPAGKISAAAAGSCTDCAAGKTSAAGASVCVDCVAGTYGVLTGQSTCLLCPVGKVSSAAALDARYRLNALALTIFFSLVSVSFPYMQFSTATGAGSCSSCGAGFIQALQGKTFCDECGIGTYTAVSEQTACIPCSKGTYAAATKVGIVLYSSFVLIRVFLLLTWARDGMWPWTLR